MNDTLRFHSLVPNDLAEAISWYEDISSDLANRFRKAVRSTFAKIRSGPETYGIIFDDVRIARLERFPYLIQYRIHSDTPEVLGIFHAASDPGKWQNRANNP